MKNRFFSILITITATLAVLLILVLWMVGFRLRPQTIMSVPSPDGLLTAYVTESPSFDPPNQSLFISVNGTDRFRLISGLPEDVEFIEKIAWSPDCSSVAFATNRNLLVVHVNDFLTTIYSRDGKWWTRHHDGTFSTSGNDAGVSQLLFTSPDTLVYSTGDSGRQNVLVVTR